MSIKIMNEAWECKGLEPTAKLVLMCLADHANEDDRTCWPSIKTISRKCDISRSTVKRHMANLANKGCIKKRSRTGSSTLYYILPEGVVHIEPGSRLNQGVVHSYEPGGGSPVNPKPLRTTKEPSKSICAVPALFCEPDFESFWTAFPSGRKRGKGKCREIFKKLIVKTKIKPNVIIEAIKAGNGIDPDYPPMPATWLNQGRWEDGAHQPVSKPKSKRAKMDDFLKDWINGEQPEKEMKNVTPEADSHSSVNINLPQTGR